MTLKADILVLLSSVGFVPAADITLVPNRLLSSFQRHNSSLHCFSCADALNAGKERGEELR
ncbi:MAG: hypothetical protein JWO13_3860 [Acidobacteriales bacterium]|nr:hypothetical protein [Terriglobales bacterium]